MPKVTFVKCARKDNQVVKKGESYYWWAFRFGGKRYSKTPPKQSQLTQSDFLGRMYELSERIQVLTFESLEDEIEGIVSEIRELGEEQEEKLSNMPEQLQYAPSGETLQSRIDGCEEWANELENIDIELPDGDNHEDEDKENKMEEILAEVQGCEYQGE